MKSKKKVGLVKRITAGVCALVVTASCVGGSVTYYAEEEYVLGDFYDDSSLELFNSAQNYFIVNYDEKLCVFTYDSYTYKTLLEADDYRVYLEGNVNSYYLKDGLWKNYGSNKSWAYLNSLIFSMYDWYGYSVGSFVETDWNIIYSTQEIVSYDGTILCPLGYKESKEVYNSSLGYLQNVQKKDLTLDDEMYNPDYDSWQVMYTFDKSTTTGLDITTGGYSVRHYTGYEVRDSDSNIVRSYDIVLSGEYDASSCKISYPLYSTRQDAMDACGFEPLSWWEDSVLGYEHYIYDYLQIVRTNEDGSVEYGGYVKISEAGEVSTTLSDDFTVDTGGYVDKDVPESSGSGSNYEDAEHDADMNAANSSTSSGDAINELNNLMSLVSMVPVAFARMFSFLPDWCLDSYGIFVMFGLSILVWRVAR